jgi:serine/threonine-protein kinase
MAPEQVLAIGGDPRSDLYQTGIVLNRLLTGELPFQGKDRMTFYEAHLRGTPRPPVAAAGAPPLPPALVDIIARALAKHPAERFPNAREFLTALGHVR